MRYDLGKLGASLPHHMKIVEELDGSFTINPSAPKYTGLRQHGIDKITEADALSLSKDCRLIGAHVETGDQEIWLLTQAGEIIRATGGGEDVRFYIVEPTEAPFYLEAYGDEKAVEALAKLGLYDGSTGPSL